MDSSVIWLILIALIALGACRYLNRRQPPRDYTQGSLPPRIDSFGIPGAADIGGHNAGTTCDSGQGGSGDCAPGGN